MHFQNSEDWTIKSGWILLDGEDKEGNWKNMTIMEAHSFPSVAILIRTIPLHCSILLSRRLPINFILGVPPAVTHTAFISCPSATLHDASLHCWSTHSNSEICNH
ncbi:hypothetical protein E2C01_082633 [Portunus trituberculatus]|uniref:Uncharacterized protein n=1 Tax=Portunus trituberculatus TaxID=210409 RepID=A0A5B7ISV2_PORTR|nr:hypothetical protein [Portunus trituberculatus]